MVPRFQFYLYHGKIKIAVNVIKSSFFHKINKIKNIAKDCNNVRITKSIIHNNKMKPTQQQLNCVEALTNHNFLKIDAVAGSGKTSTLVMISQTHTVQSLYCAFNKVTAMEASKKFGSHVTCQTTHSIAYAKYGVLLKHKLLRPTGAYVNVAGTGSEIGRYFNMISGTLSKALLGLLVKQTIDRFEQSADTILEVKHVNKKHVIEAVQKIAIKKELNTVEMNLVRQTIDLVCRTAQRLWSYRIDPNSRVLAGHDTYLKLFQLSKPKLNYKIIYLDEAADTTPCVLDIVLNQRGTAKIVLVGDDRQAIYQWRGAVNAMSSIDGLTLPLSKSFRYGPEVANVAMAVLQNATTVEGSEHIDSKVGVDVVDKTKPYTRLFRTNASLLAEAVISLSKNEKIAIEIDCNDFIKCLQSAMALFDNKQSEVKHDRILPFMKWADLLEEGKYDGELNRIAKLVKDGKAPNVIKVLSTYKPSLTPSVTMTTAHKSKGREWNQVQLEDDFQSPVKETPNGKVWIGLSIAEQNLLYVASTRAILALNINLAVTESITYLKNNKIYLPIDALSESPNKPEIDETPFNSSYVKETINYAELPRIKVNKVTEALKEQEAQRIINNQIYKSKMLEIHGPDKAITKAINKPVTKPSNKKANKKSNTQKSNNTRAKFK